MENYFTTLDYQELLKVSGEDSEKFLQGQLTCDLEKFDNDQWMLGAACNTKGRVYSSFRILKTAETFYLAMQPGVLEQTQATLKKFIPFYKAEMIEGTGAFNRYGLWGKDIPSVLETQFPHLPPPGQAASNDNAILLCLDGENSRYELWVKQDSEFSFDSLTGLTEKRPEFWQELDLDAGIFLIGKDDIEQYTPEEASMDLVNFVSFEKGCYTGQEIVARMHYKGKGLKRLHLVTFSSSDAISSGQLVNSEGKQLGVLTNVISLEDNLQKGFAVLKSDIVIGNDIFLDNAGEHIPVLIQSFAD